MSRVFGKIILLFIVIGLFSCADNNKSDGRVKVAVTIAPYKYLVKKIGGNKINVTTSIPKNATPHHYEPTVQKVQKLSDVDYYFSVGKFMPFEEVWLSKLSSISDRSKFIDLSDGIKYIDKDPHVWLSPDNLKIISKSILQTLKEALPKDEDYFQNNFSDFLDSLSLVEKEVDSVLENVENKKLLVFHGSWTYFVNNFSWEQVTIERGSREPSPQEFQTILSYVEKNNIPVVFVDPQHGKSSAKLVAEELGIPVEVINPLRENILINFLDVKRKIEKYYK